MPTPPLQNVSVMCFRIWGEGERESVWMEDVFGVSSPRIWRFMWGEFFSPVFLGLSASVCDVVVMCFEDFVRGSTSLDFLASRVSKGVLG